MYTTCLGSHLERYGLLPFLVTFLIGCSQPDPSTHLKPLLERYLAAWNTGHFDGLEDVVSDQFELRMSPRYQPVRTLDSLKASITYWRTAYPDFHIALDEVIYAPNAATVRWTIHATNSGPGRNPPTGKSIVVPGMSILHISSNKIIDEWISSNDLYWAEQLGFTLSPSKLGQ